MTTTLPASTPASACLPPMLTGADVLGLGIGTEWGAALHVGSDSLAAATAEFIAAMSEYVLAQLACVLWSDTSIVVHEICCLRRLLVAAAWLNSERERHAATVLFDANYDDATMAALLGGIQG